MRDSCRRAVWLNQLKMADTTAVGDVVSLPVNCDLAQWDSLRFVSFSHDHTRSKNCSGNE